jgi:hypothetical protein
LPHRLTQISHEEATTILTQGGDTPDTDDFWCDYVKMTSLGIKFVREPKVETYGIVAVFEDLYGNLWDLLELNK